MIKTSTKRIGAAVLMMLDINNLIVVKLLYGIVIAIINNIFVIIITNKLIIKALNYLNINLKNE